MVYWIGRRLESLRLPQGMTQETLADTVGHRQSWMSDVENGKTDPGFHEVEVMARALGTTLEELVKYPGAITGLNIQFEVKAPPPPDPAKPA